MKMKLSNNWFIAVHAYNPKRTFSFIYILFVQALKRFSKTQDWSYHKYLNLMKKWRGSMLLNDTTIFYYSRYYCVFLGGKEEITTRSWTQHCPFVGIVGRCRCSSQILLFWWMHFLKKKLQYAWVCVQVTSPCSSRRVALSPLCEVQLKSNTCYLATPLASRARLICALRKPRSAKISEMTSASTKVSLRAR